MAINQNHLFEELNGVKCAIAEKNASKERVDFLKKILEYNHYTVIVSASPPPKAAPAKPAPAAVPGAEATTESATPIPVPAPPETFTVGVTDVMFNPVNAIFGRLLKLPGGHIVTLAYWQQKESESRDDVPYFEQSK
ncbi:MAG TPA: hypothetical protein VKT28_01925 [Puia sp.]|nr:hypothetical protein [Puia sp.]